MAGDEIVADWLGDVWSDRVETVATVQRFSAASKRFKNVDIFNEDATYYGYIGKYVDSVLAFSRDAMFILALGHLKFEFIDLYELGYLKVGTSVFLKVTGTNEY
jgi:hypothetical protein